MVLMYISNHRIARGYQLYEVRYAIDVLIDDEIDNRYLYNPVIDI